MGLPAKLKNYTVFSNGDNFMGVCGEVTLPPLKLKVESWRGGGALGEVDIPMGMEKLEMETKFGGLVVPVLRQFGAVGVDGSMLRFVGAYQEDVAGGVKPAELVVRGLHTEIDPGKAKTGTDTEWTVKSTLAYLKWTVSGRTEVEIDMLNCVMIVGSVDRMAGVRAALQL